MAHPYASNKSLHTDRLTKMLGGMAKESGPKASHSVQMGAAKSVKSEMSMHGGPAKLKSGGRTKAKTNININVMPAAPEAGPAAPPTLPPGLGAALAGGPPPGPPPGPPMGGPPMGPPPGMGGPGGPPPMMPHKMGGRAYKKGGAVTHGKAAEREMKKMEKDSKDGNGTLSYAPNRKSGGAVGGTWAEGLRAGTKVQHAGQTDTRDKIQSPTPHKAGGKVKFSENMKMKSLPDEAGGGGGKGRLAKMKLYGGK